MKLDYENFEELLSRPAPEKKEAFVRNYPKNENEGERHDNGFERKQASRGGFGRGRGRGSN